MEALVALNVMPLNAPHTDQHHLPLADRDFQIKDAIGCQNHLHTFCLIKNSHLNNSHIYGIWESNLPKYYLPLVNVFPDIFRHCCANYDPVSKAVLTPSQTVLFYITTESINEMLQFHLVQPLAPLSMGFLLEQGSQLSSAETTRIAKLFMKLECQLQGPPPYLYVSFNETGRILLDMILVILGFRSSEFVEEMVLVPLSTFTPEQTPAIKYDNASFIADKIHTQFMNMEGEGVFKYTTSIYHLLLYYHLDSFIFPIRKLDSKGERRFVIFWASIFHRIVESNYTYC